MKFSASIIIPTWLILSMARPKKMRSPARSWPLGPSTRLLLVIWMSARRRLDVAVAFLAPGPRAARQGDREPALALFADDLEDGADRGDLERLVGRDVRLAIGVGQQRRHHEDTASRGVGLLA